ncbi:alcohol dehydrogenase catalytic domain-containing protein [Candidatus Synechococcus spongiarum]|uniref:Malonyl CoA-acyl carrier protein transacylase n=1 Tax=Candidatus Synechococcus spongiarum TaxID=431041 RepID=A0A165B1V5_9SYNE|nr:alcohol dehydrogenase catalytic domain-containing protein [Candidatus Synechococcus spongiarum]SAY38412.1 Malonyl CoA-acyl carrier protein transacylase (EC 2.3.1.39) [Candidatus Synechococcus spongiarum]
MTVVTRKVVLDVENPRGQALWGLVRTMAMEVGEEFGVDFRLVDKPSSMGDLQMTTCPLPPLGDRGVEIEVEAAALNFRDVMVTLGLLPALAYERSALGHEVGMEASGTVLRIGSRVGHCQVGDKAAFTTGGSIANRLVVHKMVDAAFAAYLEFVSSINWC